MLLRFDPSLIAAPAVRFERPLDGITADHNMIQKPKQAEHR
jgi:hypothetical protein